MTEPFALCAAKVFEDMVEDPYVPLKYILHYTPYRLALFNTITDLPLFSSISKIREWLLNERTLELFKTQLKELYVNDKGVCFEDWIQYVSTNEFVIRKIADWNRAGTFEYDENAVGFKITDPYVTKFLNYSQE